MAKFAILDPSSGIIINMIELGDTLPTDQDIIPDEGYSIGGILVSGVYTPPVFTLELPPNSGAAASVTPRQARLALFDAGLLDAVNAAINHAGGANLISWEYASVINRGDPLMAAIGQGLGLTVVQIDALFVKAATL